MKQSCPSLLNSPIGVFDSGSGGLTILAGLQKHLPGESFVYLGDHANAPYGPRTNSEIYALTQRAVEKLFSQGCRLVILACNTAAAIALRKLQQDWLPEHYPGQTHSILGILVPTIEAVTGRPWLETPVVTARASSDRIGLFATEATVRSRSYDTEVGKRSETIRLYSQACAELVPAIEQSLRADRMDRLILGYARELLAQVPPSSNSRPLDKVLLGCTHYPLALASFKRAFEELLPEADRPDFICQPSLCALSLKSYLDRHAARLNHTAPNESLTGPVTTPLLLTSLDSAIDHSSLDSLAEQTLGTSCSFRRV
ncbi:glutamate racemase [Kiloniella sp. b19]|uniref:glutamate racemase n=1 Tax=Kiloniella sp. GXU_MW_B19 TaxID=3141326 RepID=UPI0031CE9D6F